MKIIFDSKEKTVVKFEKGDNCLVLLTAIAKKRDASFNFNMIGGCASVDLAFFHVGDKKYIVKSFTPGYSGNIEILNVNGNVAWFDGSPVMHAHGVFSDEEYKCFGGHIMKMTISITGETFIHWLPKKLSRELDNEMCLKLLSK